MKILSYEPDNEDALMCLECFRNDKFGIPLFYFIFIEHFIY